MEEEEETVRWERTERGKSRGGKEGDEMREGEEDKEKGRKVCLARVMLVQVKHPLP